MSAIAFIGLGNMGRPMAANLLKAGHRVNGFDIDAKALQAHGNLGGRIAESALHAVQEVDVVISMLPAGVDVRGLYMGEQGLIAALRGTDALLIDSSTIDVASARSVAAAAKAAGLEMLDAPVSGGVGGATAGTLTFMVGGTEAAFARGQPILRAMGKTIVHAGPAGAGQAAKICNNMILGISMLAVSEAFVLADKLGLDRGKLFEISSVSSGQCWSLTNYCPVPGRVPTSPANRDYAAGFSTALMLKDLKLAQEAAGSTGAATPLGARAAGLYQKLADAGMAAHDFSVAFRWLSELERKNVVEE
jgi:3-hydroxyisobutyrate dehydrogenase